MFEIHFKVQHECPYVEFSKRHPEVRIVEWCNNRTDVLEIECPDIESFSRIERDLHELVCWKGGKILKKTFYERNLQVITKTCCDSKICPSISGVIQKNSFLEIPPITYHGGWEAHKVMGFREGDYKKMFRELEDLGSIEILEKKILSGKSIHDTFMISLSSAFSKLTEKQVDALMAALDNGYYEVPKKKTAEEIARKYGVPRTTYEEHVRKAESKIFRVIAPYIGMYASSARLAMHGPRASPD
jgi:predicted DNA binding protein